MFSTAAWAQIASNLRLSGQEIRIVHGMFDDQTESAIADELKVSPHTVHTHCERLYRKLGVTDRVKLILRVVDEFLMLTSAPGGALPPICSNRAAGCCPLGRAGPYSLPPQEPVRKFGQDELATGREKVFILPQS